LASSKEFNEVSASRCGQFLASGTGGYEFDWLVGWLVGSLIYWLIHWLSS